MFIRINPPKVSETNLGRQITVNAFRARFTSAEELAFENALSGSASLRVLDKRLAGLVATHVDLDDEAITSGIALLVQSNIITAERALVINSAPVQWRELPVLAQQTYIAAGYEIDV